MPDAPDPDVVAQAEAAIAGIAEHYRQTIAGQLVVLDRAAAALVEGAIDPRLRREAERAAHKLTGSAGTFGFERASDLARALEQVFTDPASAQGPTARQLLDALQAELATMATALPASRGGDRPTLLIVDGDTHLAGRLAAEASVHGLRAVLLDEPRKVGALVTHRRPDVALLGLSSSRAGEALQLLEQLGALQPPLPTLLWADGERLTDRVEVARLGGCGLLPRTTPLPQLLEAITDLLDRQRAGNPTIVAVDDDPTVLGAVQALLESHGMRVVARTDPAGFWEAVEQAAPDLVVLDVDMPGVDGVQLCRVLRTDRRWAQLPVLFLTARTDRATVQRVFAAGADDFVAKPIIGPELVTRISNRLERVQLLRSQAETDSLTGLANRRQATRMLEHFLGLASRFNTPLAARTSSLAGAVKNSWSACTAWTAWTACTAWQPAWRPSVGSAWPAATAPSCTSTSAPGSPTTPRTPPTCRDCTAPPTRRCIAQSRPAAVVSCPPFLLGPPTRFVARATLWPDQHVSVDPDKTWSPTHIRPYEEWANRSFKGRPAGATRPTWPPAGCKRRLVRRADLRQQRMVPKGHVAHAWKTQPTDARKGAAHGDLGDGVRGAGGASR